MVNGRSHKEYTRSTDATLRIGKIDMENASNVSESHLDDRELVTVKSTKIAHRTTANRLAGRSAGEWAQKLSKRARAQ